jgi:hypothetical protein
VMTSRPEASILWRRLDVPGHDAALLTKGTTDVELRGMAVFRGEDGPTALHYSIHCDAAWQTSQGHVHGWRGTQPVELEIQRDGGGRWSLNGAPCPAVAGCMDLDLSFTPATNLLPLRRLDLSVGHMTEIRSAWLAWPAMILQPLVQRYDRQSATTYHYEADLPTGDTFTSILHVDSFGWVRSYGGLWEAEAAV